MPDTEYIYRQVALAWMWRAAMDLRGQSKMQRLWSKDGGELGPGFKKNQHDRLVIVQSLINECYTIIGDNKLAGLQTFSALSTQLEWLARPRDLPVDKQAMLIIKGEQIKKICCDNLKEYFVEIGYATTPDKAA